MARQKKVNVSTPVITKWQILTVILFIILPLGGFYGGVKYQQRLDKQTLQTSKPSPIPSVQKASPDTLVVIHPADKQDNIPPLTKTITDKKVVMELYNEITSLPLFPTSKYPMNCPIGFYTEYTLDFYQYGSQVLNATYNPTGCRIVQISNEKDRWAIPSSGQKFTQNLQQALGLSDHNFYGSPQ